jgi:hypothetical protein
MARMGFFDLPDHFVPMDFKRGPLVDINAIVPWDEFSHALEWVWRTPEAKRKLCPCFFVFVPCTRWFKVYMHHVKRASSRILFFVKFFPSIV